ncbi:MAG: LysM peptidoglycan-binding domain-containing protein [Bacteroidales bacterium]|nr:LysM peptidoglycan-binding domain-containing protein [Bacteroidales bacterium]
MKRILSIIVLVLMPVIYSFSQVEIIKSDEKVVIDGSKYYLHTVEAGQTLYSICKAYGVTEAILNEVNIGLKSEIFVDQIIKIPVIFEISDDGKKIKYIVKPGDTLYSLCRKYGITEDEFYELNENVKPNRGIKVGQEIVFPTSVLDTQPIVLDSKGSDNEKDTVNYYYHLVEKGETLYRLCRIFEVKQSEILLANPSLDENTLKVGDLIKIPKKSKEPLTDQQRLVDSLVKVAFSVDSTIFISESICDSIMWYKQGNHFVISVLLPFDVSSNMRSLYNQEESTKNQRLYPITEKVVSFYSGLLIGLEQYKSADVKIVLKVYDIGDDNTILTDILKNNQLNGSDLIIGPAYKSQVEYFNSNFKNDTVSIILPFVTDSDIVEKFSNNITLRTSNDFLCDKVADYVSKNSQNNYLIIQGATPDQIKIAMDYKNAIDLITDTVNIQVNTIRFNGKSLVSLKSMISEEKENVFILPFAHETTTIKIFTELFPIRNHEITLIGPEALLSFETIDPNYFRKIKFSYFTDLDIDYSDSLTNVFITKYQETFLCTPDEYSFLAMDAASLIIAKLLRHGKEFSRCFSCRDTIKGLSGDFIYASKPKYAPGAFSNSCVYIYKLQEDFTFGLVYPQIKIVSDENNR